MRKEKRILALGIMAALLFPSVVNAAAPVQNNTILSADRSAPEQIRVPEKAEENSQLLFPIEGAVETNPAGTDITDKMEYLKPGMYFVNDNIQSIENAVTSETEKNGAKMERAMNQMNWGMMQTLFLYPTNKPRNQTISLKCVKEILLTTEMNLPKN